MVKRQQSLADEENGEIISKPPKAVRDAAEQYSKDLKSKNRAARKVAGSKDHLIEVMERNEIARCLVVMPDGKEQVVVCEHPAKIKLEKPKEAPAAAEEE